MKKTTSIATDLASSRHFNPPELRSWILIHPSSFLPILAFRLHPSSLFYDSTFGGLDKLDQRFHFRRLVHFFLDSLQGLGRIQFGG